MPIPAARPIKIMTEDDDFEQFRTKSGSTPKDGWQWIADLIAERPVSPRQRRDWAYEFIEELAQANDEIEERCAAAIAKEERQLGRFLSEDELWSVILKTR